MRFSKPEPGKPVILHVADRDLELRFTLKVLKQLDVEKNISVLKGDGMADVLRDPENLAVVLHYGVKTKDPEITLDWIEENFDASMLLDLAPILAYSMTGRYPDMDKLLGGHPNADSPAEPSTGSPSGRSDGTTSTVLN